jgi:hypothetical protein
MEARSFKNILSVALVAIISNSLLIRGSYLLVELSSPEKSKDVLPEPEPSKPEYPMPEQLQPGFPESPKLGQPLAKPQKGVDYNPDPSQIGNLRSLGGRQCRPENKCARVEDRDRSIAAMDDGLTARGSRHFPYSCCYRYWWGGHYYCRWSSWYCHWWI